MSVYELRTFCLKDREGLPQSWISSKASAAQCFQNSPSCLTTFGVTFLMNANWIVQLTRNPEGSCIAASQKALAIHLDYMTKPPSQFRARAKDGSKFSALLSLGGVGFVVRFSAKSRRVCSETPSQPQPTHESHKGETGCLFAFPQLTFPSAVAKEDKNELARSCLQGKPGPAARLPPCLSGNV